MDINCEATEYENNKTKDSNSMIQNRQDFQELIQETYDSVKMFNVSKMLAAVGELKSLMAQCHDSSKSAVFFNFVSINDRYGV